MTTHEWDAVVVRTLRYGESDIIGHLYTREEGRRSVIAKGARKSKSRMAGRLELLTHSRVIARQGRGDISVVQGVELLDAYVGLRHSYVLQRMAGKGVEMLGGIVPEEQGNEPVFHLLCNFLRSLDRLATSGSPAELPGRSVLLGFQMKLLLAAGVAPHLTTCARCGAPSGLSAWSPADGGVVCEECARPGDGALDEGVRHTAIWALQRSLAAIADADELPSEMELAEVTRRVVAGTCEHHCGFRLSSL